MARNEEVRLPGLSPSVDGKLYPEIIPQYDTPSAGLTTALIGEGHEVIFKDIDRELVVGVNADKTPVTSEAFAQVRPVVYVASDEQLDASKVAEEGFTLENIQADLASGLIKIAEPIEFLKAHTRSGAYVRQIEAARIIQSNNPSEIFNLYSNLSQWVVAASAGLSNADNVAEIEDGHGRTADSIFIPDGAKIRVAQVVDMQDFSTANVDPRTVSEGSTDGIRDHETVVGTLSIGPHTTKADGTTNFEAIEFSIRGPEFSIASKAAGFIVQTSGKIVEVNSKHKQDNRDRVSEYYEKKLKAL
jgi:hypothetical protein